jgi:hypothetical protein
MQPLFDTNVYSSGHERETKVQTTATGNPCKPTDFEKSGAESAVRVMSSRDLQDSRNLR